MHNAAKAIALGASLIGSSLSDLFNELGGCLASCVQRCWLLEASKASAGKLTFIHP